ncbi:MAG: DUF6387 family protein [Alphaproteobacteria bacterium]|nr:DUF6387 family protein [Alphaproteobacteria bacterium]
MAKAGRPKKGTAGLPKWFDIQKYACAQDFAALQWFQQLGVRTFIRGWCFDEQVADYFGDEWQGIIKQEPVITEAALARHYPQNDFNSGLPTDYLFDSLSLEANLKHGISALTNGQVLTAYKNLPKKLVFHPGCLSEKDAERKRAKNEQDAFYRAPFDGSRPFSGIYGQFMCVDLGLPHAVLIDEFRDYLLEQEKNAEVARAPYLRSPDFISWYNMGLLPYLDLKLIEEATGEGFLWSAFADALSTIVDAPIGSESSLQKTLKKCAARIDYQLIRILKAQAVKEESGKRRKSGKLIVR